MRQFMNDQVLTKINFGCIAPLKSLYFHWAAICSSSIVFTPRSLFLLFVLLFSGLIVEVLTTAATSPINLAFFLQKKQQQTNKQTNKQTNPLKKTDKNPRYCPARPCYMDRYIFFLKLPSRSEEQQMIPSIQINYYTSKLRVF